MVKCRGISRRASTLSQGLLVEVDDEEVTINRRDFHTNSWTGEPWKIKLPAKKETSFTHVEISVIKKNHLIVSGQRINC